MRSATAASRAPPCVGDNKTLLSSAHNVQNIENLCSVCIVSLPRSAAPAPLLQPGRAPRQPQPQRRRPQVPRERVRAAGARPGQLLRLRVAGVPGAARPQQEPQGLLRLLQLHVPAPAPAPHVPPRAASPPQRPRLLPACVGLPRPGPRPRAGPPRAPRAAGLLRDDGRVHAGTRHRPPRLARW